jgi:glycine cleavage system H protein
VSELFSPASGEVIEVNAALQAKPETINTDPHGAGWMIVLKVSDAQEAGKLMDAGAYEAHTKSEGK